MRNAAIPALLPVYNRIDIVFERGSGCELFDANGRRYLDFGSGIAVCGLGHAHPRLVETLKAQAEKLWHVSNLYRIGQLEELADRLIANSFAETVFACNSGAEACEAAIKMARRFHWHRGQPERNRIITFEGCFHGRTMAGISAAGGAKMVDGFAPLLDGFDRVPWADHDALKAAIGPHTAAIMIEPIQGEGGIRPVPDPCLRGLRELCDEHDILLVLDEVQCGIARTGRLFAHEWAGVAPDIMAVAKGLGGGFPVGACLASARGASGMTAGSHGSTFGGNPLACAVASTALDVMLEPGFLEEVERKGKRLMATLEAMQARHPGEFLEVRGKGLMVGVRFSTTNAAFAERLRAQGLLTVPAAGNVVRLLPPLIVSDAELDEACSIIESACMANAA